MMLAPYKIADIASLARHAAMSTTYKPALLKALTRITTRDGSHVIELTTIGAEFARLYWNQTTIFHLRQAATISKEPEVLQQIRRVASESKVHIYGELPNEARVTIERSLARILKIDVLRRFHASKPAGMPALYEWDDGSDEIRLSADAMSFFKEHSVSLEIIANYWWAKFLEKVNVLVPAIIDKVERDGTKRSALAKFLRVLLNAGEEGCFYCGAPLKSGAIEVDHFLPWSYLLADPLWDLVLACKICNAAKSDRLPGEPFIGKLATLNEQRTMRGLRPMSGPPPIEPNRIMQLYDAAKAAEWPNGWLPTGLG